MSSALEKHDLVVVIPGITGSSLLKNGHEVWGASVSALARVVFSRGGSIKALALPEGLGDEHPDDGVQPGTLLPDIHLLPGVWSAHIGYGALLDWLSVRMAPGASASDPQAARLAAGGYSPLAHAPDPSELGLIPFPYDWRLSNRYTARRLAAVIEPALERWRKKGPGYADAEIVFVCHSMGGLVARWYAEKEGGAEITRKIITLGTPHRGSLNALVNLVNELKKGIGPLKADLTAFGRSLPSLYQLLPQYACIETGGALRKLTEVPVPELDTVMLADAMRFHADLHAATIARASGGYDLHPVVGTRQPTSTTARIADGKIVPLLTIKGTDEAGDATVPRLSATPRHITPNSPIVRYAADRHGSLQSNGAVLDEIEGVLTARDVIHRAAPAELQLGVALEELAFVGEPLSIRVIPSGERCFTLQATVTGENSRPVKVQIRPDTDGHYKADLGVLAPGGYTVTVGGFGSLAARVDPVTCPLVVVDPAAA